MKLEFSRHVFEKYSNVKFHEGGSRVVVPWGWIDGRTHGQADMTKPVDAFPNCADASKNYITRTINTPRLARRIRTFRPDPPCKLSAHVLLLCVQWKTPDDGQRNCPKHVEFYSKNKFEKLRHLVGIWTGLDWPRIETVGGRLWVW